VCEALSYAHGFRDEGGQSMPIVHRDISPSNVLLDWTGGVKIADFGIAKVLGASAQTRVGIVKGTLGCMAPEQARGEAVDERADVYAAALLAWRLATGRAPYGRRQADEFELVRAMRNPRIRPLAVLRPDLPQPLLDAIARALEPVRAQRTITAEELAAVVREQIDVGAGWMDLATLLERWKKKLERSVRRAQGSESLLQSTSERSVEHAGSTLRYEEMALAFDQEDAPLDVPTFEAHALPSDPAALAAVSLAEQEPDVGPRSDPGERSGTGSASLPVPRPAEVSPSTTRKLPGTRSRKRSAQSRAWGPTVAIVAFMAAGLLAALIATLAR
jgi:serine/threonine protein kinase